MSNTSIDHLLFPRYKVTDKWPSMRDFSLNQIVTLDKIFSPQYRMYVVEDCQGERKYITKFFDDYPHLFKKLEWHEDRKPQELLSVEYFKMNYSGEILKKCKATSYIGYDRYTPATEAEYLNYINQKQ